MTAASLDYALALHERGLFREAELAYRDLLRAQPANDQIMYMLGVVAIATGRNAQAVQWFSKALKADRQQPKYHFAMGRALKAQGAIDRAIACYERALAMQPDLPEVLTGLGVALRVKGDSEGAMRAYRRALQSAPEYPEALVNLANLLREQGQYETAITAYRAALNSGPSVTAYCNLGITLDDVGQVDDAMSCYEQALRLDPNHFESNARLGPHLRRLGRHAEALGTYERALAAQPGNAEVLYGAAEALMETGRLIDASSFASRAFGLAPAHADLHYKLGLKLALEGSTKAAEESFRRALQIRPNDLLCLNAVGVMHQRQWRFSEALAVYQQVLSIDPADKLAWFNTGALYQRFGQLGDAIRCCEKALALDPNLHEARTVLLMAMNYSDAVSQDELTAAHRSYGTNQRTLNQASEPALRNTKDPDRRLRVGLVSPDFHRHSVAYFIEPLFERLDRAGFELWCYYVQPYTDEFTERFRARSVGWRQLHRASPDTLVETLRTDELDILIDLAGHSSPTIAAFNHRCAPIQITWLGYPTTTGAAAMDYRITDDAVDPLEWDRYSTESLIRLSPSYFCYTPFDTPSPAASAPVAGNGFVTLGSFNNLVKLSDSVLSLWGRMCAALPNARLAVKGIATRAPEMRQAFVERAVAAGIEPTQLVFADYAETRTAHLQVYNEIDIALDAAPYNGATTTCEALWMGVPVVSLSGHTHAARMGRSILQAAGLPELVATTPDDYVARVVALANDPDRLNVYRRELRGRMSQTPLMDGARFVVNFEHALRQAWRLWCADSVSEVTSSVHVKSTRGW